MKLSITEMQNYCTNMLRDISGLCEEAGITYYAMYGTLLGTIRHGGPIPWDPDVDLYVPNNEIEHLITQIELKFGDKYWVDYRVEGVVPKPFPRIGLKGYETEILHIDIFRMAGLPNSKLKQRLLTRRGRNLWIIWKAKTVNPKEYYKDKRKQIGAYLVKGIASLLSLKHIITTIDKLCGKYDVFSTNYVGRVMELGEIFEKKHFEQFEMKDYSDFQVRVPLNADVLLSLLYGNYKEYPEKEYRNKKLNDTYIVNEIDCR